VSPRQTREERRAQTRRDVLDAAARVFAFKGFGGASMEDIAAEAGYTRGAVYSNFDDKADLFLAVLDERAQAREVEVEEVFRASADPVAFFTQLDAVNRARREEVDHWVMLRLEFWLYALRNPEVRPKVAARNRTLIDMTGRGVAAVLASAHIEPPRPIERLATIVQALDDGLGIYRVLDPDLAPDDTLIDALGLLVEAIGALDAQRRGS
jgi:AcrR family transcriptional regulator